MNATVFTVSRHNLYVGAALVCPEARYFSVTVPGVKTLYRRSVTPEAWALIVAETTAEFSSEPLANSSVIARLICNEDPSAYVVQCVAQPFIKAAGSDQIASYLDNLLREVCAVSADGDLSKDRHKQT